MKFVNLTKKEYETLLSNTNPTNFYQDLSWLEFQSNLGHTCHILGIKDNYIYTLDVSYYDGTEEVETIVITEKR